MSRPERGTTGQVSTNWRWLRPNDKIVVDGFDDPKVQAVLPRFRKRTLTYGLSAQADIRATRERHRSPLILRCIEDLLAGKRYPLDLLVHYD